MREEREVVAEIPVDAVATTEVVQRQRGVACPANRTLTSSYF